MLRFYHGQFFTTTNLQHVMAIPCRILLWKKWVYTCIVPNLILWLVTFCSLRYDKFVCLLSEPVLSSGVRTVAVPGGNVMVPCNSSEAVFHCDTSACVPHSSLCNGIPDCYDGKDESVAQCGEWNVLIIQERWCAWGKQRSKVVMYLLTRWNNAVGLYFFTLSYVWIFIGAFMSIFV